MKKKKNDQIKLVKKEIIENKKELKKVERHLKLTTDNKNRIFQEMESLKDDVISTTNSLENIENTLLELKNKINQIENEILSELKFKKEIEIKLKEERKILSIKDAELRKLNKIVTKNEKNYNNMDIRITTKEREIKNLTDSINYSNRICNKMLSEIEWLKQESSDMNAMYEQYNFDDYNNNNDAAGGGLNHDSITARSSLLREQQSTLSSRINHKVMSMFERAEAEYRDLKKKRVIIRSDKTKIESVIRELDRKKEDTLERTYKKVNEHFGNIFSKLLPGTLCKLEKLSVDDLNKNKNKNKNKDNSEEREEASILDGLEVKVAFGSNVNNKPIWKESLSELSGGQRSLLALSLILSLLLFKPAPLYILDEIDAALDLSHTQNIGILIAKYFTKSQFIVVSLKEGMFTNANVIFRTSFVDGISAVKRTIGIKK